MVHHSYQMIFPLTSNLLERYCHLHPASIKSLSLHKSTLFCHFYHPTVARRTFTFTTVCSPVDLDDLRTPRSMVVWLVLLFIVPRSPRVPYYVLDSRSLTHPKEGVWRPICKNRIFKNLSSTAFSCWLRRGIGLCAVSFIPFTERVTEGTTKR